MCSNTQFWHFLSQNKFQNGYQLILCFINIISMKEQSLGKDIIQRYQPYRNHHTKWRITTSNKEYFQLYQQYQIIEPISSQIAAVKDRQKTKQEQALVAIKKVGSAFDHKICAKRLLRQLRLLRIFNHENIIQLKTILLPRSREQMKDIYIVFEMMEADLMQIIRSQQELTEDHHKFFLYQLLRGLKYIHSANVAHRDIKPRNILVNSNCDLKICYFRLSRCLAKEIKSKVLTDYVTNRWYRAPEILLGVQNYTTSVDMWSVGCVFAQMMLRRPFLAGRDTRNQFQLICEYFSDEVSNIINISKPTKQMIKEILDKKPRLKDIRQQFSFADPKAVDLLKRFLTVDPQKRITVLEALKHPYLQDLHLEEDEPTAEQINCLEFEFQDHNLNTEQLKDLLYEQILLYHFKDFAKEYENKKVNNQSLIKHILESSNSKNINPYADWEE